MLTNGIRQRKVRKSVYGITSESSPAAPTVRQVTARRCTGKDTVIQSLTPVSLEPRKITTRILGWIRTPDANPSRIQLERPGERGTNERNRKQNNASEQSKQGKRCPVAVENNASEQNKRRWGTDIDEE